ncbi:uncharacterized protein LOC131159678 [Malania oleifera]|uniref:uncharacterized protein LOC131159678 n=1 Tax=Malania oleifera TaxID=397392 RepID=UPI0025ADCF0B|nr:uncharacterized protein LOC131159678 [Malania oleifera]
MDRNAFLALILMVLIVSDVSNASLITKLRKLVGEAPNYSSQEERSPLPSPVGAGKESDPNSNGADKSAQNNSNYSPVPSESSSKLEPKSSNDTASVSPPTRKLSPPIDSQKDKGTDKDDNKTDAPAEIVENCDRSSNRCMDLNKMIVCVLSFKSGSKELILLVQNDGDSTLKVNLTGISVENALKDVEILGHKTKRINTSTSVSDITEVVLNAGHGNCVLHFGSRRPPVGNFFLRHPSYSEFVTPINGAYLMLLTALVFGGTWACCKFRKRRQHGEVPYQELEMGLPESFSDANVETAEGWDQGWDDDWDNDKAATSPRERHVGSISANGLASRSPNKDGWENDWDD